MNSVPFNALPPPDPLVTLTLNSPLSDVQQQKLNIKGNLLFERSFQEIKEEKREDGRRFSYPPPNYLNKPNGEEENSNFESKNKFLSILSDEMVQKKSLMTEQLDDSFKISETELIKQNENDFFSNIEETKKDEEKPSILPDKTQTIFNRLGSLFKEEMAEAEIQTFHSSTDSLDAFRIFDEQNEDEYRKKLMTDEILKNMIKLEKENELFEEKKENDEVSNYFEQEKEFREKFQSYVNKGYFLDLIEMNNLQAAKIYYDVLPFLVFRKKLIVLDNYISEICLIIIKSKIFETITLLVILANSIIMSLTMSKVITSDLSENTELIFLYLYTIEMALKIQALGFILPPNSYMKDYWNILDFVIVLTSYLPYVMDGQSTNITVLRAFRVLRPLKTISKLKKLRVILEVIFDSMNNLKDVIILMVFFYTICAIAGLQLLSGSLKRRCLQETTGFPSFNSNDYTLCNDDCDPGYFCGKMTSNPNNEITNFDTFPWSFLQVYQVVTMEGWTQIMIFVQRVFSPWMWIYFYGIVFIGAFFLQNMMLAVISFYYHDRSSQNNNIKKNRDVLAFDLKKMKKLGLFRSYHEKQETRKKMSFIDKLKEFGQRISSIPKTPFNFLNKENKAQKKGSSVLEKKTPLVVNPQPIGITLIPIIENTNDQNLNTPTTQKGTYLVTTPSSRRHSELKKMRANRLSEKSKSVKRFSMGEELVNFQPKNKINNTIQINSNNNKALKLSGMIMKEREQKRKLSRFDTFSRAIEDDDSFMRELEKKSNDLERKSLLPQVLGNPSTPNKKSLSILELTTRKKIQSVIQNINFKQTIMTTVDESNGTKKREFSKSNTFVSNTKISSPENEGNHFKLISNFSFKTNGNKSPSNDFLGPMNGSSSRKLLAKKHDFAEDEDFKIITPTNKNEESKSVTDPIISFSSFSNYLEDNKKKKYHPLPEKGKVKHHSNFSPSTYRSSGLNRKQSRKVELGEEYEKMIEQTEPDSEDERIKKKAKNKKFIIRVRQDINVDEENSSINDVLSNLKKKKLEKEMSKKLAELKFMPCKLRYTLEKRLQDLTQKKSKKNKMKNRSIMEENNMNANASIGYLTNNVKKLSLSNSSSFLYESSFFTKSALLKKMTLNSLKRMDDFSALKYFKHNLKKEYNTKFKLPLFFSCFFLHRNDLLTSESVQQHNFVTAKKIVSIRKDANDSSQKINESGSSSALYNNNLKWSKDNANLKKRIKKKSEKNIEWNLDSAREKILGISPLKHNKTPGSRLTTTRSEDENIEEEGKIKEITENADPNLYNKKIFKDLDSYKAKKIPKKKTLEISEVWSGNDVLSLSVSQNNIFTPKIISRLSRVIGSLNATERDLNIWSKNYLVFLFSCFSHSIYRMIMTRNYENSIMLCVFINTFILAMDGLITNETSVEIMNNFSFSFTIIFAIDMGLKIIGLGIIDYLRDQMNIFDGCVVIISLIELGILSGEGGSAFNAFRSVRIFRAFRVLRVSRLVRSLRYMKIIANAIARSIESFAYIALLLGIFIYIYALLGLQLFSTGYNDNLPVYRSNFKTITNSFIAAFQILTIENWNSIMVDLFNNDANSIITVFYLFSWIFIGNYILLNLFVAVLLEGFDGQEEELIESDEEKDDKENIKKALSSTKAKNLNATTNETEKLKESSQDEWEKQKIRYDDIICEISLYIFRKDNKFRRKSFDIIQSRHFEHLILIVIVLSSIKLVIDTYFKADDNEYNTISDIIDIIFTSFFTLECLLKIVSLGFIMESNSYLRETWSILDFIIVIFSLVDLILINYNLSFIKILRLLRILRPLRFISHNINMKIVVNSLLKSLPGLGNVLIFIFLIWLMFAILGINFMSGKMGYCTNSMQTKKYIFGMSKNECVQNEFYWMNHFYNFDNILYGMITLFILSTFEGWPDIMFNFFDGDDATNGPSYENSSLIGYYIIGFIMVGSIFLMNLFIAVISREFKVAQKSERKSILTEDQERWVDFQKLITLEKFDYFSLKTPDDLFRKNLFFILKSRFFEPFIIICICVNIITMGMTYDGSPADYDAILENINLGFTSVFILEFIMKITAFGFKGYFHSGWNQFDFVVVTISILDIILTLLGGSFMKFLKIGPQIGRIFRVMRITRLLKLIKSFKNLRNLIQIAIYTLPALLNVAALTFLFFFIYAILGTQLFAEIRGDTLSEFQNFDNFGNAMMTLFRCATGENWYSIMFDTMQETNYNSLFFLTFILGGQFVMLNLFVLVILDQFDANYNNPDNPLQLQNFQEDMEKFKEVWVSMTAKDYGIKINQKNLVDFFLKLNQPLGFGLEEEIQKIKSERSFEEEESALIRSKAKREEEIDRRIEEKIEKTKIDMKKRVCKVIMKMELFSDSEGYIYFNELLFYIFKNYYYRECFGTINPAVETKLNEEESKSLEKIKNIRKKIKIDRNKIAVDVSESFIKQNKSVNPLTNMIYLRLCFKSWTKFALLNEETKFEKISKTKTALKEKNFIDLDPFSYNEILDEIEKENNISPVLSSFSSSSESEEGILREEEFDHENDFENEIANPNTGLRNINEEDEYEKNEDVDMTNKGKIAINNFGQLKKKNTSKFKVDVLKIETNNEDFEVTNDNLNKNRNDYDPHSNEGAENYNDVADHIDIKEEEQENNSSESELANLDEYDEENERKKEKKVTKIINYQINNNVVINNNYYIGSPKEAELRKNSSI